MIRLNDIDPENSLKCVKELKKGNLPLCIVNVDNKNWEKILSEIAFNEDLFIAVENIDSVSEAYNATALGAQFFILKNCEFDLMKDLTENGFFYIPKVKSQEEYNICVDNNIECIYPLTHIDSNFLPTIGESGNNLLFKIIDLPRDITDYELWINSYFHNFLELKFEIVEINIKSTEEEKNFAKIFAATNKCKIIEGERNILHLFCKDFTLTTNYLKWKEVYFDPSTAVVKNDKVVAGFLDTKMSGFTILLKERLNEY